jgi:membrane protease YdiL (CAAX protease family)
MQHLARSRAMKNLQSFAGRWPILFVVGSTMAWLALVIVLSGTASSALGRPYGDPATLTVGRLAAAACFVFVLWRLRWLGASGVARLGTWPVWLVALGGTAYAAAASLYSFFGRAAVDLSGLARHPEAGATVVSLSAGALSEEILCRGLVLYALVRVWGTSRGGTIGSAVVASLLFAVLHLTHVFTYGVSFSSASLLTVQTFVVAIWWAALVVRSGSIWPAVFAHFVVNMVVALQQLTMPMIGDASVVHGRLLVFSLLLGVLGIWMLARASLRSHLPEAQGVEKSTRGSEQ